MYVRAARAIDTGNDGNSHKLFASNTDRAGLKTQTNTRVEFLHCLALYLMKHCVYACVLRRPSPLHLCLPSNVCVCVRRAKMPMAYGLWRIRITARNFLYGFTERTTIYFHVSLFLRIPSLSPSFWGESFFSLSSESLMLFLHLVVFVRTHSANVMRSRE